MAFATVEDVAVRLGRDLTEAERGQVGLLLDMATALIAEAVGKDDAWAASLDPVPTVLRAITIEMVWRVMSNPSGLSSLSERLGEYESRQGWSSSEAAGLLGLTDQESLLARRTVLGQLSGSARTESLGTDRRVLRRLSCTGMDCLEDDLCDGI